MSTIIMAACWPLEGMSPAQKAVLISLADQASDDGVCWPAVGTIARRTCLSERAVQDALAWLQTAGLVFREYRANTSTSYTIRPGAFDPAKAPTASKRARNRATPADAAPGADAAPVQMPHPTPANAAPPGANAAPPGVQMPHPNHHGTINEPSLNKARAAVETIPGVPEDLTAEWKAVRKAKRAGPISKTVIEAICREAAKAGITAEQAIRCCVERGWQGFKADWHTNATNTVGASRPTAEHKHASAYTTILEG